MLTQLSRRNLASGPGVQLRGERGEAVPFEERHATLDDRLPFGEVVVVVSPVSVLVGMLELVEGGVLGIQELPVPPQESFVDHPVRLGHASPFAPSRRRLTPPAPTVPDSPAGDYGVS